MRISLGYALSVEVKVDLRTKVLYLIADGKDRFQSLLNRPS